MIQTKFKMPKYFCDYCDTYLTHDSPSVRKTHCAGRKHRENVKFYYEKWYEQNMHKFQLPRPPMPAIPPPTSFASFDVPPPTIHRGIPNVPPPPIIGSLPTGPPPPIPRVLPPGPPPNVMLPPPGPHMMHPPPMIIPQPPHLQMPNVMQPPPNFMNEFDKV